MVEEITPIGWIVIIFLGLIWGYLITKIINLLLEREDDNKKKNI